MSNNRCRRPGAIDRRLSQAIGQLILSGTILGQCDSALVRSRDIKCRGKPTQAGFRFEEAVTVFDDPLFVLQDASRNQEQRNAVIGFSSAGRLLTVVHIVRIISAWRASQAEEAFYDQ